MAIFVSQGEAKSQFRQIFKSQNLTQFLRFGPNFLHVSSISIEVQSLNSNMAPNINPSLISKGGYQIPPPLIFKDGVVLGPMLLFSDWTSIKMELTCKKLGPNLKN